MGRKKKMPDGTEVPEMAEAAPEVDVSVAPAVDGVSSMEPVPEVAVVELASSEAPVEPEVLPPVMPAVDPVKIAVEEAKQAEMGPEPLFSPQYEPMEQVRSTLNDLEHELSKRVEELKQSGTLNQNLNEIIRLGAARHLQRAQEAMTDVTVKLEQWDKDYQAFLKEKHGMNQAKCIVNDMSDRVEQDRVALYKLKGLSDLDFQRVVSICMLPEARFKSLFS